MATELGVERVVETALTSSASQDQTHLYVESSRGFGRGDAVRIEHPRFLRVNHGVVDEVKPGALIVQRTEEPGGDRFDFPVGSTILRLDVRYTRVSHGAR